jgi:hypothetical protein
MAEGIPLVQHLEKLLDPDHEVYSHHAEHWSGGSQVEGLTEDFIAGWIPATVDDPNTYTLDDFPTLDEVAITMLIQDGAFDTLQHGFER